MIFLFIFGFFILFCIIGALIFRHSFPRKFEKITAVSLLLTVMLYIALDIFDKDIYYRVVTDDAAEKYIRNEKKDRLERKIRESKKWKTVK